MAEPTATFTMTQLAAANRRYQRTTFTGGDFGKGTGPIDVTIASATAGTFHARLSSGGATRGDIKGAWEAGSVAGGATTLIATGVPAGPDDLYLDLGISDGTGGTTWLNGTTPVAMGLNVAGAGQSLLLDLVAKLHDTGSSIASTGATINPKGRVRFQMPGDPATAWVLPTEAANGARVINSAGIAEYLDLLARREGVAVGFIGYAQGNTPITPNWLPGGTNHTVLIANLAAGGGAFEEFIWWSGHSDAASVMSYHVYRGHLDTLFADMATRSTVPFRKVLSAIPNINSASWGNFAARANIRTAQERWAADNGGFYVTMSDLALNADMVHENQLGARRAVQHIYRAVHSDAGDTGPQITGVSKSGVDLTCTVSLPAGATTLVSVGTPEVRMLVTSSANTAGAALALDAVTPITVGTNTITLKLATDPGDVPLEVWPMGAHPVADGSASGLFDDSNDGDGIARGRQLRFASAPILRKATGTLTGVGAIYTATPLGSGRSGGYLTSAGPLLPAVPYAGRTVEFKLRYDATAAVWRTILGQSGVLIVKLNTTNQLVIQYDTANSFSYTHGWAADGAWHHICIVQEPGNQRRHLVIDGVLAQTHTANGATYAVTNPFRIGANQSGAEILTTGVVDEVAIWNRAKSLTEMLIVPSTPYTGNEPGLQHLWHLDGDGADSASSVALNSLYIASRSQLSLAVAALFDGADAGGAATSDAAMSESGIATANITGVALISTALTGGGIGSLSGAG